MADEKTVIEETPSIIRDPFDGSEAPFKEVEIKQPENTVVDDKTKQDVKKEKKEPAKDVATPEISDDGVKFLKEKLGYDNWDTAKQELETLKSKAETPAEIKYANEISEKVHKAVLAGKTDELYSYLDAQKRYSKLTEGEVTISNAPAIIKANMAEKYKGLTPEQIDYKFNKQFGNPKKPIQADDELEDDYNERLKDWEEKVKDNEMDMLIEANLARPELEKLKAELKFPEIAQAETEEDNFTPEEREKVTKELESFVKNAEKAITDFEGFNLAYKDKDVEVASNYALSDEEKNALKDQLKLLAENNYNSNALFAERWVKDDLTFDYNKMVKDLAVLESYDKSSQKFVGDAVAKATLKLIKDKHKIDIDNGLGSGDLQLEDKTAQQKNEDAIWN